MMDPLTPSAFSTSATGSQARRKSLGFWMLVFLLGCGALFATIWLASQALALKGSEKLLRLGVLLPKLKNSQPDASRMTEPEPSETAPIKERTSPPPPPGGSTIAAVIEPPKATSEPPRLDKIEPVGLPTPLPLVPILEGKPTSQCMDPLAYLQPCAPQRGDSPMMRTWKTLSMYSLLATASVVFVPQPVLAGNQDEVKKSLDELTKRIAALENKKLSAADQEALGEIFRTELKKLENGALAELKKGLDKTQSDVGAMQLELLRQKNLLDAYKLQLDDLNKKILAGSTSPNVDKAFMEELRSQFKILTDTIAKLGPTEKRAAMYPSNGGSGATTTAGRVVIVNLYNEDLLFLVNGSPHRVPARTTVTLPNVPIGTLRYEVVADRWGVVDRQTVSLSAGDTFTLTASNPR